MEMTRKEAILKVLEERKLPLTDIEVYHEIQRKAYIDWGNAKTPKSTIAAGLGNFIRKNDTRIKRVSLKMIGGRKKYKYYLSKYEEKIDISKYKEEANRTDIIEGAPISKGAKTLKVFEERDLHKLLSSYLKNKNIYSKTIFHEKSTNRKDSYQKWTHPDMIGIKFLNLKNKSSQALMKIINKSEAFELASYELKREIKSDYDLKKTYFQAVSNSSWANFGYLVAFEISSNLKEEMRRLNQSFGIGIIELKGNPYESEILFPAKNKELDFKTIDKLCEMNKDFEEFILQTELILSATDIYLQGAKNVFEEFCDAFFAKDSDIKNHCIKNNIPY